MHYDTMSVVCCLYYPSLISNQLQFIEAVNCKYPAQCQCQSCPSVITITISMYPGEEARRPRPALDKEDVAYLLEKTTFDEYDVREWFREFIKARQTPSRTLAVRYTSIPGLSGRGAHQGEGILQCQCDYHLDINLGGRAGY